MEAPMFQLYCVELIPPFRGSERKVLINRWMTIASDAEDAIRRVKADEEAQWYFQTESGEERAGCHWYAEARGLVDSSPRTSYWTRKEVKQVLEARATRAGVKEEP